MLCLLFWNLKGNDLSERVARICLRENVDIAVFAENGLNRDQLANRLTKESGQAYTCPFELSTKLAAVTRLPEGEVQAIQEEYSNRLSVYRVKHDGGPLLICAVHFQSRVNWEEEDQFAEATRLAEDICTVEDREKNTRTVVIGDLNMDPHSHGVVAARGLHAISSRKIAERLTRVVAEKEYRFFYNPMWGMMGDRSPGPPGTLYFDGSGRHVAYFWHTFDQVLVRPKLADWISEVRVLEEDGVESLIDENGRPRKDVSDHLPLLVRLSGPTEAG